MSVPYRDAVDGPLESWERLARAEIERVLQPDEELLWYGRPPQGLRLAIYDVVQIPFSLMWGGFAIFWEMQVLLHGAPLFFVLWGLPFVAMGIHLIAGRFLVDRARRARTYYALTSRRALILSAGRRRSVASFDLAAQRSFRLNEGRDGRGTITLESSLALRFSLGANWPGSRAPPSFEGIERAAAVYAKLLEVQRALREPGATRPRVAPLMRVESREGVERAEADDERGRAARS